MEEIELYRPSNGCEGMWFEANHCEQCIHEHIPSEKYCDIVTLTNGYDKTDPEYPNEWRYVDGKPTCTAWKKWDWGNDDDDDGWNEPPEPEPEDPMQLLMPFGFSDLFKGMDNVVVTKNIITTEEVLEELASS